MNAVDRLLHGSIDMHIHFGPDPRVARSVDALQAARQAQEAGMRAIVLKSHDSPTAHLAYIVNQIVPGVTVFGSISLDFEVGGLNVSALEASARLGAKVVWMPTFSSDNDMKKKKLNKAGITVFDGKGKLLPVVGEILDIVREYKMVLATGHLSTAEAFTLVDEAVRRGVTRMVVTHAMGETIGACFNLEEQRRMAAGGAFIEHSYLLTKPSMGGIAPGRIAGAVREVGAEHCIISTDLGKAQDPCPAEGMKLMIASMLDCGLSEREVELMAKVNPARLLDLD